MEPPRLARVVAHSLWLTVVVSAQFLFLAHIGWSAVDSDPDLGTDANGALLFLVLVSPI